MSTLRTSPLWRMVNRLSVSRSLSMENCAMFLRTAIAVGAIVALRVAYAIGYENGFDTARAIRRMTMVP